MLNLEKKYNNTRSIPLKRELAERRSEWEVLITVLSMYYAPIWRLHIGSGTFIWDSFNTCGAFGLQVATSRMTSILQYRCRSSLWLAILAQVGPILKYNVQIKLDRPTSFFIKKSRFRSGVFFTLCWYPKCWDTFLPFESVVSVYRQDHSFGRELVNTSLGCIKNKS